MAVALPTRTQVRKVTEDFGSNPQLHDWETGLDTYLALDVLLNYKKGNDPRPVMQAYSALMAHFKSYQKVHAPDKTESAVASKKSTPEKKSHAVPLTQAELEKLEAKQARLASKHAAVNEKIKQSAMDMAEENVKLLELAGKSGIHLTKSAARLVQFSAHALHKFHLAGGPYAYAASVLAVMTAAGGVLKDADSGAIVAAPEHKSRLEIAASLPLTDRAHFDFCRTDFVHVASDTKERNKAAFLMAAHDAYADDRSRYAIARGAYHAASIGRLDPRIYLAMASIESGGGVDVMPGTGSARGPLQITYGHFYTNMDKLRDKLPTLKKADKRIAQQIATESEIESLANIDDEIKKYREQGAAYVKILEEGKVSASAQVFLDLRNDPLFALEYIDMVMQTEHPDIYKKLQSKDVSVIREGFFEYYSRHHFLGNGNYRQLSSLAQNTPLTKQGATEELMKAMDRNSGMTGGRGSTPKQIFAGIRAKTDKAVEKFLSSPPAQLSQNEFIERCVTNPETLRRKLAEMQPIVSEPQPEEPLTNMQVTLRVVKSVPVALYDGFSGFVVPGIKSVFAQPANDDSPQAEPAPARDKSMQPPEAELDLTAH